MPRTTGSSSADEQEDYSSLFLEGDELKDKGKERVDEKTEEETAEDSQEEIDRVLTYTRSRFTRLDHVTPGASSSSNSFGAVLPSASTVSTEPNNDEDDAKTESSPGKMKVKVQQPEWKLEIHQLDVGQGDGAFVVIRNLVDRDKSIFCMIDGGKQFNKADGRKKYNTTNENYFTNISNGRKLNIVFKGSEDNDHSGGLPTVNNGRTTDSNTKFFSYHASVIYAKCEVGETIWNLCGMPFPDGAPNITCVASNGEVEGGGTKVTDDNSKSLGFLIEFAEFRFFTGGDLGSSHEDSINFSNKPLSISKTGHHGSEHSTSKRFIDAQRPRAVIISHGANYDHPTDKVLNILQGSDTRFVYLTNPMEHTRKADAMKTYPKTVVAGDNNYALTADKRPIIVKKRLGSPTKNPKGHIVICVDSAQAETGEFSVGYDRRPPNLAGRYTKSTNKLTRSVKDKYQTRSYAEVADVIHQKLDKTKDINNLNLSEVDLSDSEGLDNSKPATCKIKVDQHNRLNNRISIKVTNDQGATTYKKRYFADEEGRLISRTQENYRKYS